MKKLCLIRHAKSSWKYPELDDFERPLNARGKKDAPLMGKVLIKHKYSSDMILSSPATRAAFTARILADIIHFPEDNIYFQSHLYEADTSKMMSIIRETPENVNNLILVGHNPGLTSLANALADHFVSNIPTCGIYCMKLTVTSWKELSEKCGKLIFFEYPKKYY
jgi:phosphohistidine phosphatase